MSFIGLLDCNNFFVSCERVFRPDLLNKPVVVLSSNDGCVVARSNEVKDIGIPMGVPYFQIKDTLSDIGATVFSSNFKLYRDLSRRVFYAVKEEMGEMERYSIDECFFYLNNKDPLKEIRKLKDAVERQVGIPVSIGLARTKTQAKHASKMSKRTGGLSVINTDEWLSLSSKIDLSSVWGVGPANWRNLQKHHLKTVADVLSWSFERMKTEFGVFGENLFSELSGQPAYLVDSNARLPVSMMSSGTFSKIEHNIVVLRQVLQEHLISLVLQLASAELLVGRISLFIQPSRYGDFSSIKSTQEIILDKPTRDLIFLNKLISDSLSKIYQSKIPYKRAGIVFSNLSSETIYTESLFSDSQSIKYKFITDTILNINHELGSQKVTIGQYLPKQTGRTELPNSTWRSPSYTTDWTCLKTVRT